MTKENKKHESELYLSTDDLVIGAKAITLKRIKIKLVCPRCEAPAATLTGSISIVKAFKFKALCGCGIEIQSLIMIQKQQGMVLVQPGQVNQIPPPGQGIGFETAFFYKHPAANTLQEVTGKAYKAGFEDIEKRKGDNEATGNDPDI